MDLQHKHLGNKSGENTIAKIKHASMAISSNIFMIPVYRNCSC